MRPNRLLREVLPILTWGRQYGLQSARHDLIAGVVVFFITVPQVIAFAFLAGLPAEAGLYAAMAALICYAAFGSSRTLVVGPAAIIAMMTLESASAFAEPGAGDYGLVVVKLGLVTGVTLIVLRIVNFGAVISFLSHAVVTGFISAAAILIITNQVPSMLGIGAPPTTSMSAVVSHIGTSLQTVNLTVLLISLAAIVFLWVCRIWLAALLRRMNVGEQAIASLVRLAPMCVVIIAIAFVAGLSLDETAEVGVVGHVPTELPDINMVSMTADEISSMFPSAFLMAMVIFMESTSIGTAVASRRREKIEPNQELVGLGIANLGSSMVGGFPVAGSFARTLVNFTSGAATPVSSLVTAVLVMATLLWLAPLFFHLPKGVLSAIIVISVAQLIDPQGIRKIFSFNRTDAVTFTFTFMAVLGLGVESGILTGIIISFVLLIRSSSKPHIAVVGRWENTEHFRNMERHDVKTSPRVLAVRIDESLYFVNTRYIETFLFNHVAESQEIEHVLLICTATNFIDTSGLEMLELLSENLEENGVTLHLAEVKGPVMDRLVNTDFYKRMKGKVYFTTDIAMKELAGV